MLAKAEGRRSSNNETVIIPDITKTESIKPDCFGNNVKLTVALNRV